MSKDSSANYYQNNKAKKKKKPCERDQIFSKEKKATIWLQTIQKTY